MRSSLTLLAVALFGIGCSTFDPKHPLIGHPTIDATAAGYWIWIADGVWHVRMTPGERAHRFQGSMSGVSGGVTDFAPTRPELRDRIALVGDSVQFDVDATTDGNLGFDARVAGGCARFELYVDGKHHAEQVRLGPRAQPVHRTPFERCP
jgi:hypothetical protein